MPTLRLLYFIPALLAVTALAWSGTQSDYDDCISGDPARSIPGCTRLIDDTRETTKNRTIAYSNRCLAYYNKGDDNRAFADCTEAIKLDPKYPVAYFHRGLTYQRKGDFDHAIADYSESIRLDPKAPAVHNNRGNAYHAKGEDDLAIADFGEAIRLYPQYAGAYYNRGVVYQANDKLDPAIADYGEAIRLDPKYVAAFNNRGTAYQAKGNFERAIADQTEAIKLDPKFAVAYNNRGNAYLATTQDERAIADYSEAIRLAPGNAITYMNRGRAYLLNDDLAKARADLVRANEGMPRNPYAALWLDIAERRSNRPSHLSQAKQHLDMTVWPAPLVRLFLGEATPMDVLAAARAPDPHTKKGARLCEANFFTGENGLLRGAKDKAPALFRLALKTCPKGSVERIAAQRALKALGAEQDGDGG